MLTEKQINEYSEKGFTILDYQLSDSELDEIKSKLPGIDQLIKNNVKQKLISIHKNINL